ncbi:MAG: glycosyl transferase [Treponema sp.]|jgi:hypothetical protein|nr:glycosyl transferase [Treponema sp.]
MIPKIIHYCWLSGDPIPEDYQRCMDTWREKLFGYEIVLWDTNRFDIACTLWTKQAFETQLYACAADYIRLYAIYTHGGFYLDMDIEVIKSFDPLLDTDILLAYENHISENIEAGCFGAESGHPYIKKCIEYFEDTPLFEPSLLPEILKLKKSERHEFINPLILPEIMKNVLQESFSHDQYHIFSWDYFTAKNVVTGNIEATENTFTIHHFATQYHSREWREWRKLRQKTLAVFGERCFFVRPFLGVMSFMQKTEEVGLCKTMRFYWEKYFVKRGNV